MSRFVVLPEAEDELSQTMRWYEARRVGLGLEFLGVVEHTMARIAEAPNQFPPLPSDPTYRRAVLPRFPYLVIFEVGDDFVEIVAVAHAKRLPSYWKGRGP